MLSFIDKRDYLKISAQWESDNVIDWQYEQGEEKTSGQFIKGVAANYQRAGEVFYPFDEVQNAIDVQPKSSAQIEKEKAQAAALARHLEKEQGQLINGVQVSLSEENQNGIASVLAGAELAAEVGHNIFPINFNAMTAAGVQAVRLNSMDELKAFALAFMAARQQFFQ